MTTPTPLPLDAAAIERLRDVLDDAGPDDPPQDSWHVALDQCEAALTLTARVAELERERDAYKRGKDWNWDRACKYEDALDEQKAHANALRDALVKSRDLLCEDGDWLPGTSRAHECITAALIAHPAASLAAHDAEVLDNVLGLMDSVSINYTESEWHELGRKLREQRDALAAQAMAVPSGLAAGGRELPAVGDGATPSDQPSSQAQEVKP